MAMQTPSNVVALIAEMFPWVATKEQRVSQLSGEQAGEVKGLVAAIEAIPSDLLLLNSRDIAEFTRSLGYLQVALHVWIHQGVSARNVNGRYLQGVYDLLQKCPDAVSAPSTAALAFVEDPSLREQLRLDITWANNSLTRADWKAATVLAGSVVEALLLWALSRHDDEALKRAVEELRADKVLDKTPTDLDKWGLHDFSEVAARLRLISSETITQVRLAKDFRNLIHPGRAIRLSRRCDRGTALAALAAVEMVATDLEART